MVKKGWKEETAERLAKVIQVIQVIQDDSGDFGALILEGKIKTWINENELGMGQVMNPLRLALVGAPKGPGVFDIMEILGKDETINRIQQAISILG